MRLLVPLTLLVAAAAATPAAAARDVLAPGLVRERIVLPGPVVAHVLRIDRYPARRAAPDGPLYSVEAVPAGPMAAGRRPLSAIVRARMPEGAVAGINGDFFSWSGVPTGLLLTGRGLLRDPAPFRSSAVLDAAGALHVGRLALDGSAIALSADGTPMGPRAAIHAVNRLPRRGGGEAILYSEDFGARTPPAPGVPSLVMTPLDPAAPLIGQVDARVVGAGGAGGIALPGRLVLALGGSRGARIAEVATPGTVVRLQLGVPGLPPGALTGVGGGPALVVGGEPVADAGEGFTEAQVVSRTARSAVGQRPDGSLLLVSVEDGRSGPSRGATSAETAELMARLGAQTAMGLDSGGSAGISVLGEVPATVGPDGERAIADALVVRYRGVQVPVPEPQRVSPDGDHHAETTTALIRLTSRSAVRADLLRGRRRVARLAAGWRPAGARRVRIPVRRLHDGRYRVRVAARREGDRHATRATRVVVVDRTLGHLRAGGRRGAVVVAFRLTRRARVTVRVRVPGGWRAAVRGRRLGPGRHGVRLRAPAGRREVQVVARSSLGTSTLRATVGVRRR